MIWDILGIEQTKDEEQIKTAYRDKLHYVNPEDDAEGFKELRRAYEEAMEYANSPDEEETDEAEVYTGPKDEVDKWIDRVEKIYEDVSLRRDEEKWKTLLADSVCDDLDTELEASERLLAFFMSHSFLPQNIWQLLDNRFHYRDNYKQLVEKFPENYLEYVKWQIENQDFFDYNLFEGQTDDRADEYINILYQLRGYIEMNELENAGKFLKELEHYKIFHPFAKTEEAEYYLKKSQEDNGLEYAKKALDIMEEVEFEYSDNSYVERVYADTLVENKKTDKALEIYNELIEKDGDKHTNAMIGKAKCFYYNEDLEQAKELLEDVLEDQVQNQKCLDLLDSVNEKLVLQYTKELEEKQDAGTCYQLGWCYYQQKKFDEGIALLDTLPASEEYDYINLRCRLYLANEQYEDAYPLAKKWLELIEATEDDGSKEAVKRKNRLSLALFSLGICMMELDYKKAETEEEREQAYKTGVDYLEQSIERETNFLVRLSYKEQLARFDLEAKQYEKCIDVCDEIIAEDRGFFPAYVHRQRANSELRNAKEVIDDYFACKELYPAYVKPYILAAEVFLAFEQYDDVEEVLNAAKEADLESDALELFAIRVIHYREFNEENTKKALKRMEALRDSVYSKMTDSKSGDRGDSDELTDIEDLFELEKEYAILYWDLDKTDMTMGVINSFLEENPDHMDMLQLKADVLYRENKMDEALQIGQRLAEMNPGSPYYMNRLGGIYERRREYEKAIRIYQDVLNIDDENEHAIRRLMYIYSFLSNRERDLEKVKIGIEYATRLIEVNKTAEGYIERGNLLIDLYDLEGAVRDCKKAIDLDPEACYAYNNLGCALLKLRRVDEAIDVLEQVIKMDPEYDHLPYINLAECYALKKRYQDAIDQYHKVMDIWPERVGYLEEVAELYAKMGNYKQSIETYENIPEAYRLVDEDTKNSMTYISNTIESCCDIIKVCAQQGDYKSGNRYVKKAMKLLNKYKGQRCPSKVDCIIEYYRDQGDYKTAKLYGDKLLHYVKKRGYNDKLLIFAYVTVLFELGQRDMAEKYVKYYFKQLFENEGTEEKLFSDKRYIPMHSYNFAIMNICRGDTEKACEYLARIPDCKLCVMCVSSDCFEYYFGMGLVAELNGRLEEAKCFYEKAIEIKGRYASAENHLKKVNAMLQKK